MNDTQHIEHYLLDKLGAEDTLIMDARLLVNKELSEDVYYQNQTYLLVRDYSRKKLRAEIKAVERKMFNEKIFEKFRQKISSIFKINL